MKYISNMRLFGGLVIVLAAGLILASQLTGGPGSADCDLAITNVNVVTMADDQILAGRSVLMGSGSILAIEASSFLAAERCAATLDGEGRYLTPGLVDTHIHVETSAFAHAFQVAMPEVDFETAFTTYTAYGVTGVRIMSGAPDILAFRDHSGGLAVPRMVVASRMLSGTPPVLPEPLTQIVLTEIEARSAVQGAADAGYDFIKVRDNLDPDVLMAIIDEAHARGMYVDGHINRNLGAAGVMAAGQDAFAHLDELAIVALSAPGGVDDVMDLVAGCGCFISTAIGVSQNVVLQVSDIDTLAARPEMAYVDPFIVGAFWMPPKNPYLAQGAQQEFFENLHAVTGQLLVALTESGAALIAGSDALNPMIIPGVGLHNELQHMVDVGLTPYQALATATSAVAEHVPGFENAGVLEPGRRADAVLVDGNPLEDLGVLRRPRAVILAGDVLDRDALDALLERSASEGVQ